MIGDEKVWLGSERDHIPLWLRTLLSLVAQYVVAVGGAMIIGLLPEAYLSRFYYNTDLNPYSPAIALAALVLGYLVSVRIRKGQAATFVWVVGLLWLAFGMYDSTRNWSASWSPEKTRWAYIVANFLGPTYACSGSECLNELFFTTPFTASIAYSIGAYIRRRQGRRRPQVPSQRAQ